MVAKTIAPTGQSIDETLKETGEDCNLPEGYWVGKDDLAKAMQQEEQKKHDNNTG